MRRTFFSKKLEQLKDSELIAKGKMERRKEERGKEERERKR